MSSRGSDRLNNNQVRCKIDDQENLYLKKQPYIAVK